MSHQTQHLDKTDLSFQATILSNLLRPDYGGHLRTDDGDMVVFHGEHTKTKRQDLALAKQNLKQQRSKEETRWRLEKKLKMKKLLALQ